MYDLNDIELIRININIAKNVKEWYQYKAKSMGMSMSTLMAYILTDYYDKQIQADTIRMACDDSTKEETKQMYKMMFELLQEIQEEKQRKDINSNE
jgi:antitoxin component of RelBE/YafQ-DinJ toxin-antitoxin module